MNIVIIYIFVVALAALNTITFWILKDHIEHTKQMEDALRDEIFLLQAHIDEIKK